MHYKYRDFKKNKVVIFSNILEIIVFLKNLGKYIIPMLFTLRRILRTEIPLSPSGGIALDHKQ